MKRLIKLNDAKNLDPSVELDAQIVLDKIIQLNKSLTPDKLLSDVNAGKNAIYGLVSDDSQYVMEIYSYEGDVSAVAYCRLENGVPNFGTLNIVFKNGYRSEIKNEIISNGLIGDKGEKITFSNQLTKPVKEDTIEEENI